MTDQPTPPQQAIVKATVTSEIVDTRFGGRDDVQAFAARLRSLVQNGKRLADDECIALAQFSLALELNPFVGEAYYIPGTGPVAGIAGWRGKADKQLEYERVQAKQPFARWHVEYVQPDDAEMAWLMAEDGDIAVKAILTDTLSRADYEQRKLKAMVEFARAGIQFPDVQKYADVLVGVAPAWTALGIVKRGENFGGDKMPRYERACKRAEKAAIKKRFPRINLPEAPRGVEVVDGEVSEPPAQIIEPEPQPRRTQAQNLAELGY